MTTSHRRRGPADKGLDVLAWQAVFLGSLVLIAAAVVRGSVALVAVAGVGSAAGMVGLWHALRRRGL